MSGNGKTKEGKRDKFIRLVEPRVERALHAIYVISLLGGKNASNYDFGDGDVARIEAAITEATAKMVERMSRAPRQLPMPFSIPRDSSCSIPGQVGGGNA